MPNKQYKYWIDVQDLLTVVTHTKALIFNSNYNPSTGQTLEDSETVNEQNTYSQDSSTGKNNKFLIDLLTDNDLETTNLIQSIEKKSPYPISEILQIQSYAQDSGSIKKKVYFVENQKFITQVYQSKLRQEIKQVLQTIVQKLEQYQNKFQNKTLRLCFSSQSEVFQIFIKIFGNDIFQSQTARKILSELWEVCTLFRSMININQNSTNILMCLYFYFKIQLFICGRDLFDIQKRDYPLHKAVFENNLPLISRLINCQHDGIFYVNKNEIDVCGNTPLLLAVKLGLVDAVKVLSDLFTCPKLKSFSDFPCVMDIAIGIKNKEILKILLETNQKIKQHYLDMHKESIFQALESLPDFKIDIQFNCKSHFIPFVKNVAPNDTFKIHKQGSNIRLDMTLLGFKKLKCVRGNVSVLFKGRGQQNEGELLLVNHTQKSVQNIFSDIVQTKIEKDLDDILNEDQYQKLFKAEKFKIDPEIDKKGFIIEKTIEGYRAEKYQVKTTFVMTKYKISMNEMQNLLLYKTFDEYLEGGNILSKEIIGTEGNEELKSMNNENCTNIIDSEQNIQKSIMLTQNNKNQYDHSVINNTIINYTTNTKITKKTINAGIWLCKKHPLSLDSFLPLLHVLSFSSKQIAKFKDYLDKYQLPKDSFPLKAKIPLFMTMKAAFSLQNLSFDTNNFQDNLFTVDEDYFQQKPMNGIPKSMKSQNNFFQIMNLNNQKQIKKTQHTLNEIYKLCKTDEDYLQEEEDSESLERADKLFNSMMKKQINQSEELLLERSSYHSEHESVDLSEKRMQDESFKLGNHAFQRVKTMNQINKRHEDDFDIHRRFHKNIYEYKGVLQKMHKGTKSKSKISGIIKDTNQLINTSNNDNNQTINEVNIIEKKNNQQENKTQTNVSKTFTKVKTSQNGIQQYQQIKILPANQSNSDTVQTLKKNFQTKNLKNYKNMIKYSCNQAQILQGVNNIGGSSLSNGSITESKQSIIDQNINSANTPLISTADTSVLKNTKIQSFFAAQQNQTSKVQFMPIWSKPPIKGTQNDRHQNGQYLQTIESEEIVGTEGPENFSQIGNQTIGENNSITVTQSNFDDAFSKKSFVQSSFNNSNLSKEANRSRGNQQQQNEQQKQQAILLNSSRESSIKSQSNGGNSGLQHQQVKSQYQRHTQGNVAQFPFQSLLNDNLLESNKNIIEQNSNINKEDKRALINHSNIISSIHNYYVNSNAQQTNQFSITPQKNAIQLQKQALTPDQQQQQIQQKCEQNNYQQTNNTQQYKALLPPKVQHKRQSSYGSGNTSILNSNLADSIIQATPMIMMQKTISNDQKQNINKISDIPVKQTNQILNAADNNIFTKIFGSTFSRANANVLGQIDKQKQSKDADISSLMSFKQISQNPGSFTNNNHQPSFYPKYQKNSNITNSGGKPSTQAIKLGNDPIKAVLQTFDSIICKNKPIIQHNQGEQKIQDILNNNIASRSIMVQNSNSLNIGNKYGGERNANQQLKSNCTGKKTNDADIFLPYQF